MDNGSVRLAIIVRTCYVRIIQRREPCRKLISIPSRSTSLPVFANRLPTNWRKKVAARQRELTAELEKLSVYGKKTKVVAGKQDAMKETAKEPAKEPTKDMSKQVARAA